MAFVFFRFALLLHCPLDKIEPIRLSNFARQLHFTESPLVRNWRLDGKGRSEQ